ncbi:MAG: cupin domain-containing protein [Tepidiformaceae bacterium]
MNFATLPLPTNPGLFAPDGSSVRVLLALPGGSMAHFELPPGQTSTAVVHRTVDEIWYVIAGRGEMWREQAGRSEITPLEPGICLTIPVGTRFQFRSLGPDPLTAVAVTMPPWPGDDEAIPTEGPWPAST